jgi:hypothetical protein
MTQGQILTIGPAHLTITRIIILIGWIRIAIRQEFNFKLNELDKVILLWLLVGFIIYNILWQTQEAFVYISGITFDIMGSYFLYRCLMQDFNDLNQTIKFIAIIIVPLALLMLYEKVALNNLFSFFGGVPPYPIVEETRTRSMGPFRHAILAGTFGASLVPLFVGQWSLQRTNKLIPVIGIFFATLIVIVATSSGPVLTYLFILVGLILWNLRDRMRTVRWVTVAMLIVLNFVMKDPIWFLYDRLSSILGGTGWHRSYLIDRAIYYFNDWWLLGTKHTAHWMPYTLVKYESVDITCQYIWEAVNGGILTLMLFILVLVIAFKRLGRTLHSLGNQYNDIKLCIWCIGINLSSHAFSFLSVAYFDQTMLVYTMSLAMISTVSTSEPLIDVNSKLESNALPC